MKLDEHASGEGTTRLIALRLCLSIAGTLDVIPPAELRALRTRADSNVFNLMVVGEFKRGKSSVLNALIGADILPVGVVPLTSVATILEYGDEPMAWAVFQDDKELQVSLNTLRDYVTEKGNPANAKGVREVRIAWPSVWLKSGVRLIDTPGIGSVYRHNTDVTYRFLPKANAVLFLLSVDQPVGQAEYDFLKEVREYAGRIFFLLNKTDLLSDADLAESAAFASRVLAEAMGGPVPVFPVSARLALEGHKAGSEDLLAQSRFPAFTEALESFLMEGKGNALAASLAKGLLRLVSQARFNAELALSSLTMPAEELRRKVEIFEKKRGEVAQEKHDFVTLLEAEVKRLAGQDVTADVEAFKAKLTHNIEAKLQEHFESVRHLPSGELHEALLRYVVDEVRTAWDGFRHDEDEKLDALFQAICGRFSGKIDATVDELYRFSSELFSIPFVAVGAESAWSAKSGFYYKFWETPGSLKIMTTSLLHALPKFLGDALILKAAQNYGRELADTQAGRVRYDFAQRLDKSMRDFKVAMLERLDATLEGIATAVKKGVKTGAENAAQADDRARELAADLERLNNLAARLPSLIEAP
ncbi:MAG TPA: dynamin family protein [Gallionella sp.]|nr:dynamin family protein [Gallionella sp.]HUW75084.1 dynamin family protein [Gallionella sp.]